MWNTKECLLLPTGVRDDDQCQAVCQQVCEMMNNVKRLVNMSAVWQQRSWAVSDLLPATCSAANSKKSSS